MDEKFYLGDQEITQTQIEEMGLTEEKLVGALQKIGIEPTKGFGPLFRQARLVTTIEGAEKLGIGLIDRLSQVKKS